MRRLAVESDRVNGVLVGRRHLPVLYVRRVFFFRTRSRDIDLWFWFTVKHLPLWFPGAQFKRDAVVWKAKMEEFVNRPYEQVKQRLVSSSDLVCSLVCLILIDRSCIERWKCYGLLLYDAA